MIINFKEKIKMLRKKIVSLITTVAVCGTILGYNYTSTAPEKVEAFTGTHTTTNFNKRLGGKDRYDTNIAIAEEFAKGNKVDTAILASGIDYPDSLSSAPLTKIYNAPILITEKNRLTPRIEAEMKKLGIKHVIIVGGTGVVSEAVNSRLKTIGISTERLAGADRYATSLAIASKSAEEFIKKDGKIRATLVATSSYTDVLSLSPVSCGYDAPIVLVKDTAKSIADVPGLQEYFNKYVPKDLSDNTYSTYGTGNIDIDLYMQLPRGASGGGSSDIDHDKYLNNLVINYSFTDIIDTSTFVIANGQNFPDALGGAALAGKLQAPILFTGTDIRKTYRIPVQFGQEIKIMDFSAEYVEKPYIGMYKEQGAGKGVYLLGGTAVVPDNAVSRFR